MTHILLVSFPAQGHINPTLQLAKLLARRGVRATFVTALHAHLTISAAAENTAIDDGSNGNSVRFAPISDGFDPATVDILKPDYPQHLQEHGSRSLAELLLSLAASGQPVDCVVYNFLLPWVADVATELAIPSALLWIQPVTLLAIYYHFLHRSPHLFLDLYKEIEVPGLPQTLTSRSLPSFLFPDNPFFLSLPLLNHMFRGIKEAKSRWVLVNSFESLEAETISSLRELHIHPTTIGPLVPAAYVSQKENRDSSFGGDLLTEKQQEGNAVINWLNSKPSASVVYVSFGSMATLTPAQIDEIAYGLMESGHYFIWVVRPPKDYGGFPGSFSDMSMDRGMVVKWCSQVEVLAHPSVGCFVTHAGWNSTLEGLVCGKPMVCVPQWSDQPTNSEWISHVWRTGIRAKRNEAGVLEREELKGCLKVVMEGESGEEMRKNAMAWKEEARAAADEGGSSDYNIQDFISSIRSSHKEERKENEEEEQEKAFQPCVSLTPQVSVST
ncbi:unnamed protein product [Victoria cruziana]